MSRRGFLKLVLSSAIIALIGRGLWFSSSRKVLRPPGAVVEDKFLRLCIRCGRCIDACKEHGSGTLEYATIADGIKVQGTPKVNPLKAPCEAIGGRCEGLLPCVKACPTGALRFVRKEDIKLGSIVWDGRYCIAYQGGECFVCVEVCPTGAAVRRGRRPVFIDSLCVGCGRCVYACPAIPKALKLVPRGEKRVEDC